MDFQPSAKLPRLRPYRVQVRVRWLGSPAGRLDDRRCRNADCRNYDVTRSSPCCNFAAQSVRQIEKPNRRIVRRTWPDLRVAIGHPDPLPSPGRCPGRSVRADDIVECSGRVLVRPIGRGRRLDVSIRHQLLICCHEAYGRMQHITPRLQLVAVAYPAYLFLTDAGCPSYTAVHRRWSGLPCCCCPHLEQSTPTCHVRTLYVRFLRLPQGLSLQAFIPVFWTQYRGNTVKFIPIPAVIPRIPPIPLPCHSLIPMTFTATSVVSALWHCHFRTLQSLFLLTYLPRIFCREGLRSV